VSRHQTILRLKPTYVRRFYVDGGRLGLGTKPGETYQPDSGLWIPERWIASTVTATNPHPIPGEGLSFLEDGRTTLRDAIAAEPERLLGPAIARAHGPEWRVLVKILDPWEPIVFHFHARDVDVQRLPHHFPGHRFGKDEAYYFLERPKATMPYTHAGLWPGVTLTDLVAAIRKGRDYALELSPVFYQRYGEGFYVPAGVPHRPGSALTLEVQQPSDVYTLLEREAGGQPLSPEQMHPGFPDLDTAFQCIDWEVATQPDFLARYALRPRVIEATTVRGEGEEAWIFPPEMTPKFSGKRVRVERALEVVEARPHAVFIWEGEGTFAGIPVRAGDELFVGYEAAVQPHVIRNTGRERLELFKFFPQEVDSA